MKAEGGNEGRWLKDDVRGMAYGSWFMVHDSRLRVQGSSTSQATARHLVAC